MTAATARPTPSAQARATAVRVALATRSSTFLRHGTRFLPSSPTMKSVLRLLPGRVVRGHGGVQADQVFGVDGHLDRSQPLERVLPQKLSALPSTRQRENRAVW